MSFTPSNFDRLIDQFCSIASGPKLIAVKAQILSQYFAAPDINSHLTLFTIFTDLTCYRIKWNPNYNDLYAVGYKCNLIYPVLLSPKPFPKVLVPNLYRIPAYNSYLPDIYTSNLEWASKAAGFSSPSDTITEIFESQSYLPNSPIPIPTRL